MSSLCSLRAAAGRVLPSCRIRTAKNAVSLHSACAAVGYALVSLHPNAEEHVDDLAALARKKSLLAKAAEKEGIRSGDCFFL